MTSPGPVPVYPRPVPLVGDPTSAAQRAGDPAGWAMPGSAEGLYAVVAARRDVRRYRPDPVPDDVLQRVLAAGHAAPSVGHSQPWRFVVVRDPAIRDRAAVLTDRERLRQAARLEPDAARRLLDLQLEGVREAPLGIVVCCDRRTPAAGVLGRATFPDADLWSCAAAIQNLWLAARAEGLGMGWVTLFRPEELAGLVGLPDGVATLGWLCLGWPDERPPAPGLERAGWSRRLPLSAVVVEDRWPADDGGPAAPPSHLRAPGREAVVGARDEADRLLTPPGSLGVLDRAVDRVVALGRGEVTGGTLVLAAADHPVAALGVSAYEVRVTRDVARAALAGVSVGATAAAAAGLATVVVDAGVAGDPLPGAVDARPAGPRGDLAASPALTGDDVTRLLAAGRALGAAHPGLVALGEVGVGNTTVAAALAAGLLAADPAEVTGLGAGADSDVLERKRAVVAAAVARAGAGLDRDPARALAELGGPELTVLAGVVLGAAEAGTAVVLDGFAVSVAALAAVLLEPGAQAGLVAGQRSRERGHDLVLQALGLEPLLDLRLRAGEGAGAALAAGLLLDGLRVRRKTARVD
ncbi:nicotinate-nucleotide--dimethylbenzimidazole phosphoribosyltransferase [Geodermatophilus bullaregiensis]|uniref:5,6-dimethylbenzimidazole synthase n=1 Tax=Geodermatophilus bullaregiensis TaxID=1564160 RepID=UPI0027DDA097|nr:5,6-dimethylbenzimidazole synthase [Geodermatophilus bullaregiensis]MBM7806549.1 nicotinate-nucleotide--dimethylbenzimidazole phosphoribosyltransferase [Geodermatophilus bullaregiensis]